MRTIFTTRIHSLREANVFSRICLAVCRLTGSGSPHVIVHKTPHTSTTWTLETPPLSLPHGSWKFDPPTPELFKLVHLGTPHLLAGRRLTFDWKTFLLITVCFFESFIVTWKPNIEASCCRQQTYKILIILIQNCTQLSHKLFMLYLCSTCLRIDCSWFSVFFPIDSRLINYSIELIVTEYLT